MFDTSTWPVLPGRHRNHGGVKKWEVARQDIIRTLKERRYCSTMFDYYAMPGDWPGRKAAVAKAWHERATCVEEAMLADIVAAMGGSFDPKFFIPYVQLHEFEALTFADVEVLAGVLLPLGMESVETLVQNLGRIVQEAGNPEAIDDGQDTCPSRRIAKITPAYKKRAQGPIVTARIGINALRDACRHFGQWLSRLEQLK